VKIDSAMATKTHRINVVWQLLILLSILSLVKRMVLGPVTPFSHTVHPFETVGVFDKFPQGTSTIYHPTTAVRSAVANKNTSKNC